MKKRLICCLIVLALCLSIFAACATRFDGDTLYITIQNIERDLLKVTSTPDAYELPNTWNTYDAKGNDATIYIKWKIEDCNLIDLTNNGDTTTVNIPTNRASNIPYTLRATLVSKNGKEYLNSDKEPYTAKVNRTAPAGTGSSGGGSGGIGGDTPTQGNGTLNSPYTVAQALAEISKLEAKTYSSEVYVRGVVTGTVSTGSQGDLKFDIVDSGSTETLNVRYPTLPAGVTTVSEGDIVVVSGALTDYNGTKEITFYKNGNIGCAIVSVTPGSGSGDNTGDNQGGGNQGGDNQGATSGTVTIVAANLNSGDQAELTTLKSNGITLTFAKGNGSNAPVYYTNGSAYRLYYGNTLTITGGTITKLVITFAETGGNGNSISANGTTITNEWQGSTTSLTLTIGQSNAGKNSGHVRITSIQITIA